jgi:hypothetical protein
MAVGCRPTEPKAEWPLTIGNLDPWLSDYFIQGKDIGKTRPSLSDLEFRVLLNESQSLRENEGLRQAMKARLLSYNYK